MRSSALASQSPQHSLFRPKRRCHIQQRRSLVRAGKSADVDVEALPLPEGSLGLPLVGETLSLLGNPDGFGNERCDRFGDIWKTNILGNKTVMVYGEDNVRQVLAGDGSYVESVWPDVTAQLVGPKSLNILKGAEHSRVKRMMYQAFSSSTLAGYIPILVTIIEDYFNKWENFDVPFSGLEQSTYLACALFCTPILGFESDMGTVEYVQGLLDALSGGFQTVPLNVPFSPYRKAVRAREALLNKMHQCLEEMKDGRLVAPGLKALTETKDSAGMGLTGDEIGDGVMAMLFGNASMGPTIAKLLQYTGDPSVQSKLKIEQDKLISKFGSDFSMEVLDAMQYCDAVVQEALRITPLVPATFKKALKDFELNGKKVPEGWQVCCHVSESVRRYNEDEFNPERWVAGSSTSTEGKCPCEGDYSLPFGVGIRSCLGQPFALLELKLVLAMLVRNYKWAVEDENEEWNVVPLPRPKNGLMVSSFNRVG